jgi:hypothetical protein
VRPNDMGLSCSRDAVTRLFTDTIIERNLLVEPDHGPFYTTPRWVRIFGIIALVLVLVIAIIIITGIGGPHGPSRHLPSSGGDGQTESRS